MNTSRFINLATAVAMIAFILIILTPAGEPIMRTGSFLRVINSRVKQ